MLVTLPFSDLLRKNEDIYKNVVIAGKRARQIINDRGLSDPFNEDYESLDSVYEDEQDEYIEIEKVIVTALDEYLGDELEWTFEQPDE